MVDDRQRKFYSSPQMKRLPLFLLVPWMAFGQEIKPFDKLGRDNVTVPRPACQWRELHRL